MNQCNIMARWLLKIASWQAWPLFVWLVSLSAPSALAQPQSSPSGASTVTHALQLRRLASRPRLEACTIRIEGVVLWASRTDNKLFLQDDSGGVAISIDLQDQPALSAGQKVILEGKCLAGNGRVTSLLEIDNDGIHGARPKSETFPLPKGLNRIHLEWFNLYKDSALSIEWAGPGFSRQAIPARALFRTKRGTESTNQPAHGLEYRCYEGAWEHLPDFHRLTTSKTGTVSNFDIGVRSRNEEVGMVFDGFINIPKEGNYTFWINSDDGSRFYIGANFLHLQIAGTPGLPAPQEFASDETVTEDHNCQWTEVEGIVTYVGDSYFENHLETSVVEISSGTRHVELKLLEKCKYSLHYLLGCKIKAQGICQIGTSTDQVLGFSLLVPDASQITISEITPSFWAEYPMVPIASLASTQAVSLPSAFIHISGTVCENPPQNEGFLLKDRTGQVLVKSSQPLPKAGKEIEILGLMDGSDHEPILQQAFWKYTDIQTNRPANALPLLTEAIQVKRLAPKEAAQGYPVKLRGIITAHLSKGFVIQDSTWSMFCRLNDDLPKVGENWEVEGVTDMDFAPTVKVNHLAYLGEGILPRPIHPSWDELINGSLDTQYIEAQGVATTVSGNSLLLLAHEGKVWINFPELSPQMLAGVKDALIRVRGVLTPSRDMKLQIIPMHLRLNNAMIDIDAPAPAQPFESPLKKASDLLHFDANANALRRVRLAGQVIYRGREECFLMDGQNGWRFQSRQPVKLKIGDLVTAVGFPVISSRSPLLQEAVIRHTGSAELPAPTPLQEGNLLNARLDSTLVRIKASLLSFSLEQSDILLQLQAGNQGFIARLDKNNAELQRIEPGSQLELTGVYVVQAMSNSNLSPNAESFELLLASPSDVRILAKPSWWTARHALLVIASMLFFIAVALVWIALLRQQVEERSRRLAVEIKNREQVESERILEMERSRIARDLHDDLGATLTQIGFLSAVKSSDFTVPGSVRDQLKQVSEKSRHMVGSLDQIVWAINPANDSLRSLIAYLRHITDEFFRSSAINCRLDIDKTLPDATLTSEVRHNLCLSVREALNNSAKHSHATELWLRIHWKDQMLQIIVQDNGCGFTNIQKDSSGIGLANMKQRLEKIGGHFECRSQHGTGTECRMILPLKGVSL
jgi:signal transduction histidine kinase